MNTFYQIIQYNVFDNLDAYDYVISGNWPSSEMLTSQSQQPEWAKQVKQ